MRKVFEVITETGNLENSEIVETRQFVTSDNDDLLAVVKYFTKQCEEYMLDLKSIREVLSISTHIGEEWQ